VKKIFIILVVLLTGCTLQPELLTTAEAVEWSVDKDTIYYLNEPVAKIVIWVKATAIPLNSTCDRSRDYKSQEHYESIHGLNTLETVIVKINKTPKLNSKLIKFSNTNYNGIQIIR
jgi:hypothetical protein